MNNGIIQQSAAVQSANSGKTLQQYIKAMEGEIKKALPAAITPERFTRIVLSAISTNPQLASCTPKSFLGAMMASAQLGLEPNTSLQLCYLIPYRNHGQLECQFQLGYKGMIDLAYRSGDVTSIQAQIVYENDEFEYEYGLEPKLMHKPAMKDRGEMIAVYAVFKTVSGGYGFQVMSIEDVRKHAQKFSQSFARGGSSPWVTNFEEMAKKTVLKSCLKYAPMKSEFQRGLAQDMTIKTEITEDMYTAPDTTVYEAEAEEVTEAAAEEKKEEGKNA